MHPIVLPVLINKLKDPVRPMRIQVRTSINVRTSTVPSTPNSIEDEPPPLPPLKSDSSILEKVRSKSPIPLLNCRNEMSRSRFKLTQRPPRGSRLSVWLHGFSVVENSRGRAAAHTSTYCYSRRPPRRSNERVHRLRPVNSTRGVIDPVHSPASATYRNGALGVTREDPERLPVVHETCQLTALPQMGCSDYYDPPKQFQKYSQRRQERACLPTIENSKIRRKILGCLVFGTLLTILLTTCESQSAYLHMLPLTTYINIP